MLQRPRIATTVCLAFLTQTAFAFDIESSGHVSTELEMEGFRNGDSAVDAKLQLETKRKEGTKAQIEIRGKSTENAAALREAFIDHKFESETRLRVGLMKKRLGLEYERDSKERYSIRRSPIYRKLEEFTFVGYETIIKLEQRPEDNANGYGYAVAFGYNDSIDADINASFKKEKKEDLLNYGIWLQGQSDHIDDRRQFVWSSAVGVWADLENFTYQFELLGGQDPVESEFEKDFGNGNAVLFYAVKTEFTTAFSVFGDQTMQPVIQISSIAHDHREPGYRTDQVLAGTNVYVNKRLRWALNLEYLSTNSKLDLNDWNVDESNARLEVTYFF